MRETGRCLEFPFQRQAASVEWRGSMLPSVCEAVDPRLLKGGWCDSCPPLGLWELRASQASSVLLARWYRRSHRQSAQSKQLSWRGRGLDVKQRGCDWELICSFANCVSESESVVPSQLSAIYNNLSLFFSSLSHPLHPLPQHLQQHENAVEGDACYYHCVLCNYSTKAKLNLIQHVRSMKHQRSESLRKLQRLQKGLPEEEEDLSSIFTIRKCPSSDTGQSRSPWLHIVSSSNIIMCRQHTLYMPGSFIISSAGSHYFYQLWRTAAAAAAVVAPL